MLRSFVQKAFRPLLNNRRFYANRVPLHQQHVDLGGEMVEFGGFEMPLKYRGSMLQEHEAVRKRAGVFDVSHMGQFEIKGTNAGKFVNRLVTNNVKRMEDGMAQYSPMCNPAGGTVDDLLIYRKSENQYMLVVNAANIEKDWEHVQGVARGEIGGEEFKNGVLNNVEISNISDSIGLLALQGPQTFDILEQVFGQDFSSLKYYRYAWLEEAGRHHDHGLIVSRNGYTGEKNGVELYCSTKGDLQRIWDVLLEAGVQPAGLAARDILRLEAGFCLYGHELNEEINPLEAGLGWAIKLKAGPFVGRTALREARAKGLERKVVPFIMTDPKAIPRQGYRVVDPVSGDDLGEVTSGTRSPMLERGIGLALIRNQKGLVEKGSHFGIQVRKRVLEADVCGLPIFEQT